MFETLKKLEDDNRIADFLFPSLPSPIKGKISFLSEEMVMVDSVVDEETFQYITHPNSIVIVQKK